MKKTINTSLFFRLLLFLVAFLTMAYIYIANYISRGDKNCLSWIDENKVLVNADNINSFLPVKYEMLSSDYKEILSEEEFNNISTGDDIYKAYLRINSLSSKLGDIEGDVTTDGWKNHLYGTLYANKKTYHIQYHLTLRTKHFSFKPEIILWTIDIEENKES